MDIIELLINFGLTRQEAAIYKTLFVEGPLTGYEVSKLTGISRSNAYTALASLVEKGAANSIEGAATRYSPLPAEEFCQNKIRSLAETQKLICENMPVSREETNGYITIQGERHIMDKMINMIDSAERRLYLCASSALLALIEGNLKAAIARGLKVVIITGPPYALPGSMVYYTVGAYSQLRLITDSKIVLTGEMNRAEDSTCLYSKKQNLVDLIKDSIKNEIRLIELTEKRSERT